MSTSGVSRHWMPEPADSSLSRRGAWIGLRTLRQRPKVVDHTATGEPIFEVRSVRLLLQPESDHFNRLETCSKCGRHVPGAPVRDLADLDRPSNPLICTSCVQAVAKPNQLRPGTRRVAPARGPAPASPAVEPPAASEPAVDSGAQAEPTGDRGTGGAGGTDAVQDDIRTSLQTVTELLEGQRRELGALSAAVLETRAGLATVKESHQALAQSQEDLDRRVVGVAERASRPPGDGPAGDPAVEEELRHNLTFVTELLQAQQRELAALSAGLAETRTELRAVTESHQSLARSQDDLDRRLADVVKSNGRRAAEEAARTESLARDLEGVGALLSEGLSQVRAEATDLVSQLREDVAAFAQAVEAERRQSASAGDAGARAELSGLGVAVGDLRTSSSGTDSRLRAVEQALEEVTARLAALVDAQSRPAAAGEPAPAIRARPPADMGLLDALDRQLQEAEGRLSQLAGSPRPDSA